MNKKAITKVQAAVVGVIIIVAFVCGIYYYLATKPVEKVTLRMLTFDYDYAVAMRDDVPAAFEEYTNGRIGLEVDTVPYDACREKITVEGAAKSSAYDLMGSDCTQTGECIIGEYVYCLEDLEKELRAEDPSLPRIEWENFRPEYWSQTSWPVVLPYEKSKKWGYNLNAPTPFMGYRKDLLEKYGIEVPRNWDEFREACKRLTLDTDGDGKIDLWGTTLLQGGPDNGYSDFTIRLMGMGPCKEGQLEGYIFDDNAYPIFNGTQGDRAMDRLMEIRPYCPPGFMSFDYGAAAAHFYEGKVAFILTWCDCWAEAENPKVSKVVGKVGYTVVPFDVSQAQSIGSCCMFINRYTKHVKEAYIFMAWLASKGYDVLLRTTVCPIMIRHLIDPEVIKEKPAVGAWKEVKHAVPMPVWYPEFIEAQRIIWEEVTTALADKKDPYVALDDAAQRVYDLMKAGGHYG